MVMIRDVIKSVGKNAARSLDMNGGSRSSYWTTRSLFFLDGTIVTVGESKYFKDRSSAGRNFLITGYDFDSGWTKGFPYKSAATISAPAADAALIAADVNNFLYDSGGTPNQIPVVSLFQNIDYENTIYCKHSAQLVDANGVETYEPRVSEIFMTAAALSASDLIKANTYFSVPSKTANAVWIDPKNGVDETGDGTEAKPYKTIIKVESLTLAAGTQVYMKTGTETFADRWTASKSYKLKCIGFVKFISTHATYTVTPNNAGFEIEGAILNATGKTNGFYVVAAAAIKRCYVIAGTNGISVQGAITTIQNNILNGSTYGIYNGRTTGTFNILGNFTSASCTYSYVSVGISTDVTLNYKYNRDKKGGTLKGSYTAVTIFNNEMPTSLVPTTGSYTAPVTIKYNKFVPITNGNCIASSAAHAERYSYDVQYNNIVIANNLNVTAINLVDQVAPVIKYNRTVTTGTTNTSGNIYLDAPTTDCHPATVQYNYYENPSPTGGYGLYLGNENVGAGDDNLKESVIEGNVFKFSKMYNDTNNVIHGVFITRNTGCRVRYNYISGSNIGIVFKSTTQDNVTAICSYNLIYDCQDPLCAKGFKNTKFYGNTILNANNKWAQNGCNIIENGSGNASTGCEFKNNIVVDLTSVEETEGYKQLILLDTASLEGFVSDYNVLYSINNRTAKISTVLNTFAQWQAGGKDAHSSNSNPQLTNFIPAVPITGETLDAAYDDGLDKTTSWGDANTIPSVVLKQQGANWQMGAYVK